MILKKNMLKVLMYTIMDVGVKKVLEMLVM
jgi:hypothetical protein